jgi:hypothetical protein
MTKVPAAGKLTQPARPAREQQKWPPVLRPITL